MSLPTSRDLTFGTASKVTSAILNTLQDCIIGRKYPPTWWWRVPLGRAASEVNLTWDTVNGFVKANPGPANFDLVPLLANVGDRITTIGARVLGTGAGGTVVIRLYRNNGDGTARTQLAALNIVTPPAAWAFYSVALGAPETVTDQKAYFFQADIPTTNQSVGLVGYQSDRL